MNKRIVVLLVCLITGIFVSRSQDAEFQTLKTELNRNFSILKNQPVPAYYIYLRLDEIQSLSCVGRMGYLQVAPRLGSPTNVLSVCMRVGDRTLDNSHEIRDSGYGGGYQDVRIGTERVPVDNNPAVLKNAIWLQLDDLYKQNIQIYQQIKTNIALRVKKEDQSPDFSVEKPENYYEAPVAWEDLHVNPKEWEDKVRNYSAVFNNNPDITNGTAYLSAVLIRKIFVDTEGREIVQNTVSFQLALSAETLADDGMSLPLAKTWTAFSLNELPSDSEVLKAAKDMSSMLSNLKKAPVVESFTGPAILSPAAAGVFFHEIFGHRVEGSRLKQESDAQTFKKKIGELVLPKHLSVIFDPTLKYYQKTPLNGNYVFDDEGIRGQRVEVVKNGVLKNFLMCRTPIQGFDHSNGHGRAQIGAAPISRQSNLIVESSQKLSREELIKKLRKDAKAQGKPYAYFFDEVAGGFTNTNRYSPNSFNITPLVVYRIYTDGRPDELVRGVNLVGTPLAMFSQIEACGNEYAVFNGTCGAESGPVPVACVSPALLVKQIETQKRAKAQSQPPYLPKPEVESASGGNLISQSIKKEVDRALEGLSKQKTEPPFFISYTLGDIKQLMVSASNGSLLSSQVYPFRTGGARLLMGNYQRTDENFTGTGGGGNSYGYDGTPCLDNNEAGIRNTLWRDLDAIYKSAVETYEQKLAAIKQLNIPAKDLELPDWDKTPALVRNDIPVPEINLDPKLYEDYVKAASSVFNEYKEILRSNVALSVYVSTIYFYNTEKSEYKLPVVFATLDAAAMAKTEDGEDQQADINVTVGNPKDLPSIEDYKNQCRKLAENLMEKLKAPKLEEAYTGPVLFENLAVVRTFYTNFFNGDNSLIAQRKPFSAEGYSYGGNRMEEMIDKRITAKEITIEDMTGTPEYKGVKLLGYTPFDAQAVIPPAKLTLVENGILKTLLNDRVPTAKVPHSNGHSLFTPGAASYTNTGVVRMSHTLMKSREELRSDLFSLAKEEGYKYAYIIRNIEGTMPTELYQVNIADGTEKRIRAAAVTDLDFQSFKKIHAVSNKEMIYNGIAGNLLSVIVPDAILFDELQIQSDRVDNYRKPPVVGQKDGSGNNDN